MGQAAFMGGSALFFTVYILIAEAFGILGQSTISDIDAPGAPDRGGFFGAIDAIIQVFAFGFDLVARFFQLLTFQAPGLEAASMVTIIVFVPLTFINGWIIVSGILKK